MYNVDGSTIIYLKVFALEITDDIKEYLNYFLKEAEKWLRNLLKIYFIGDVLSLLGYSNLEIQNHDKHILDQSAMELTVNELVHSWKENNYKKTKSLLSQEIQHSRSVILEDQ